MLMYNEQTAIIHDTDIKVQLNLKLTLVLRPITQKTIFEMKDSRFNTGNNLFHFRYKIISNMRFVTHFSVQVNIYKKKKMLNTLNTWALHLILNEQNMSIKESTNILFCNEKNKYNIPLVNLYQILYLYFSTKNTI